MASVFENLKEQREVLIVDAPSSFEAQIAALDGVAVRRDPVAAETIRFAPAFVTRQTDGVRGAGLDTVRLLAIDDDWSALRFRRVALIGASRERGPRVANGNRPWP